jgi:hypothetical protein
VTLATGCGMQVGAETTPQGLGRGQGLGIAIAQLTLVPVLFFIGFGFMFVGIGLSPDGGEAITLRDGFVLALYLFVMLTVLLLLIGGPTLLLARRGGRRPLLERRAAYIPLGFAAVSTVILIGLGIAGWVFDQVAGV